MIDNSSQRPHTQYLFIFAYVCFKFILCDFMIKQIHELPVVNWFVLGKVKFIQGIVISVELDVL